MAQHTPIIFFKEEKWFKKVKKKVENVVHVNRYVRNSNEKFLDLSKTTRLYPIKYAMDERTTKVLAYRCNLDIGLDSDNPKLKIKDLSFEIHIDKDNNIVETYIVV